jgi:hypothetical protein
MLGKNSNSNKQYPIIANGKVRIPALEGAEGAETRKWEKDGKSGVKHEYVYDFIRGYITGMYIEDNKEYGTSYRITIEDGLDTYILSLKTDSRYGTTLISRLPLVKTDQEVLIVPYHIQNEGKKFPTTGVSVYQGPNSNMFTGDYNAVNIKEERVENFFDKGANGCPYLKEEVSPNRFKMHKLEVIEFLEDYAQNHLISKFLNVTIDNQPNPFQAHVDSAKFNQEIQNSPPPIGEENDPGNPINEEDDDMPF